jgi:hypothetical protein
MLSTLDLCMVPDHISPVVHVGNLSLVPTRPKQAPTPRRSLGNRRQTGPAVILGHLILPPSQQPWSRGVVSVKWLHSYISLLVPYHQLVIGTFNTYPRGPTHRSLTDTGRGYNLEGVGFPHSTPQPPQPTVLPFPSKVLSRSLVYPTSIN